MSIDIYQPCPCQSGRKIKFCCGKDIVGDLNEIIELSSGRQLLAALDHINRVIQKTGVRDCLLTLKTHFLIKLNEFDEAKLTNEQFVANNPDHSIGHQHRATLYAAAGETNQAVNSLQDALDRLPGDEVPISLSNGFRLVGLALLNSGDVFAARSHLRYAIELRGNEDSEDVHRLLLESYRMPWSTLLLKEDLRLPPPPADAAWAEDYQLALRIGRQAQWRQAVKKLEAVSQQHPGQPLVIFATAAMYAFLADRDNMVAAMREYAADESIGFSERVEAEVLAQYFDARPASESFEIVRVTISVSDPRELNEAWSQNPRLIEAGPVEMDSADGPPPIAAFVLLDREPFSQEQLDQPEDISIDQIPVVVGNLMLFGKQTDRPARVESFLVRDPGFDKTVAAISDAIGESGSADPEFEPVDEILQADFAMRWDWHLPHEIPTQKRRSLMNDKLRQVVMEQWTDIPFTALGGQSPSQAIGQQSLAIPLAALVQRLESHFENQGDTQGILQQLVEKLELPAPSTIDPEQTDPFSVSAIRQRDLDFAQLSNEQIETIFTHGMMIGNFPVLRKLIPQLLEREHLKGQISFPQALTVLARITIDNEQSLEHLKLARQLATANSETLGKFLVIELDIRLERGIPDKCEELMREIQGRHLNEPDVEMMLVQTLSRHGLIRSDGRPLDEPEEMIPADAPTNTPAVESDALWTPDSAQQEPGNESKLWLPGSD